MSRPDILFPLFADLTTLDGVGPKIAKLLGKMTIERPADLILTLPTGGVDRRLRALDPRGRAPPEVATVEVEVGMHQPGASRTRPYRVHVRDALTEFQLVFFHPHPDWLRRHLPSGSRRIVSGKVEIFDGIAQMVHPDHILRPEEAEAPARLRAGLPADPGPAPQDHGQGRRLGRGARPRPARVDRAEPQAPPRLARLAPRPRRRPRPRRARADLSPGHQGARAPRLRRAPLPPAHPRHRPQPDEARPRHRHPRRRAPPGEGARRPALRARPAPRPARSRRSPPTWPRRCA